MMKNPERRGVVTLWTLLCLPLLMLMLLVIAEYASTWHGRVQVENAVEAAALAAVQHWGDLGGGAANAAAARDAGRLYALANTVHGRQVDLDDSATAASVTWGFGTATPNGTAFDFTPAPAATAQFAVMIQAAVKVPRFCKSIVGNAIEDSTVVVTTAAYYDPSKKPCRPRLIRVGEVLVDPAAAAPETLTVQLLSPAGE